jgi:lipopolysaccharide export system permease protein
VTIVASAISLWGAPASYRNWRDLITSARAEFVSQFVREGRFNIIDSGIVFHYRERVGDALLGLFIQDRRDPELTLVYVAERGQIIESPSGTFLVLLDGSVQRETTRNQDASIIGFKRYALDLALLSPNAGNVSYRPRERTTTDLFSTALSGRMTKDERGSILSELTERISTPLYAIAFAFIALAAFAKPKSTRQKKWIALVTAITFALLGRLAGFAFAILIQQRPEFYWTALACPIALSGLAFFALIVPRPRLFKLNARLAT